MYKIIIAFAFALLLAPITKALAGGDIAVIVNKENSTAALSESEVKLYWMKKVKKRWPELNKNIRPADYKTKNALQTAFYANVIKLSASDIETYFTQKQYESAEKPQEKLNSEADMINFVSNEAGAIGFVNASSLTEADKARVKVICVVKN